MYATHDHIEEIKCIICSDTLPYYCFDANHICEWCRENNP